jgi:hypothetical protein
MSSPPTQRAGPPPQEPGPKISRHQATDPGQPNPVAVPAQLRRRRAASYRCPPLPDGRRDPLDPVGEPLTDPRELDSWRVAWVHLDRLALPAIVPPLVLATGRARRRDGDAA